MVKFTIKNSNPSGLEMTKELRALIVVAKNSGFYQKKKMRLRTACKPRSRGSGDLFYPLGAPVLIRYTHA